eukprot:1658480-Alexandrium_andersonii.AAC.1
MCIRDRSPTTSACTPASSSPEGRGGPSQGRPCPPRRRPWPSHCSRPLSAHLALKLSLIHISEPTRVALISYAIF